MSIRMPSRLARSEDRLSEPASLTDRGSATGAKDCLIGEQHPHHDGSPIACGTTKVRWVLRVDVIGSAIALVHGTAINRVKTARMAPVEN